MIGAFMAFFLFVSGRTAKNVETECEVVPNPVLQINKLLKSREFLIYRSRSGRWEGMDSDTEIYFSPKGRVALTEFGYAVITYKGKYRIDRRGFIKLSLRKYRGKWPPMRMCINNGQFFLFPTNANQEFIFGGRAGATLASDMAPFWPFRLLDKSDFVKKTDPTNNSTYNASEGLRGAKKSIPLPEQTNIVFRQRWDSYYLEGYRWVLKSDLPIEKIDAFYKSKYSPVSSWGSWGENEPSYSNFDIYFENTKFEIKLSRDNYYKKDTFEIYERRIRPGIKKEDVPGWKEPLLGLPKFREGQIPKKETIEFEFDKKKAIRLAKEALKDWKQDPKQFEIAAFSAVIGVDCNKGKSKKDAEAHYVTVFLPDPDMRPNTIPSFLLVSFRVDGNVYKIVSSGGTCYSYSGFNAHLRGEGGSSICD